MITSRKPVAKTEAEKDWVNSRKIYNLNPGHARYLKTCMNRRFRKESKLALKGV